MTGPWAPLGAALAAFHDRGEDVPVSVRNDFGPSEEIHVSVFFRGEEAFEDWEALALDQCGRRVLDVGACVGAHALVLQERGHQVTALDPIPEAVRIMQERGVDDAREGTLFELPSGEIYDTVILLMNGSMIAETLSGLDRLLASVSTVLERQGALILDSTDLRDAEDKDEDQDGDRYIGELQYQLRVGEQAGDVFPQLFVDPGTLEARARLAGWDMEVIWRGPGGRYLARLGKAAEWVGGVSQGVASVTDDAAGQDCPVSETFT